MAETYDQLVVRTLGVGPPEDVVAVCDANRAAIVRSVEQERASAALQVELMTVSLWDAFEALISDLWVELLSDRETWKEIQLLSSTTLLDI